MTAERKTRRDFFRSCGRSAVLGGLAAVGVVLGGRRGGRALGERCSGNGRCSGCAAFEACGLAAAEELRRRVAREERFARAGKDGGLR